MAAKTTVALHSKPLWSLRLRDRSILIGASLLALTLCAVWLFFTDSPSNFYKTTTSVPASDGVTSTDCTIHVDNVDSLHDPLNSTFYDDRTLSYSIDKPIENWDEKRRRWLKQHPTFDAGDGDGDGDRVLLITGSQPSPCKNPMGDHFLLRFFKNKVDYCRIHGYDIFYGNTFLHPKMRSYWAKLPLIRAAMVAHPEAEWIWWVDSDAVFTDLEFKLPLRRYKDHNLVVHGWADLVYRKKSWVSLNAGVFLIRNCQWSMDFIQVWASMGPQTPDFEKWGRIQKSTLPDKMFPASDDQSALVYLLLKERKKWADKIYIEGQYYFQGYWLDIVGTLDDVADSYAEIETEVRWLRRRRSEKETENYAALREPFLEEAGYGRGSWRRPFITHFTGCQPCNGDHNPLYAGDSCRVGMERALNFADNQVLGRYGFVHLDVLNSSSVSPLPFDFAS